MVRGRLLPNVSTELLLKHLLPGIYQHLTVSLRHQYRLFVNINVSLLSHLAIIANS